MKRITTVLLWLSIFAFITSCKDDRVPSREKTVSNTYGYTYLHLDGQIVSSSPSIYEGDEIEFHIAGLTELDEFLKQEESKKSNYSISIIYSLDGKDIGFSSSLQNHFSMRYRPDKISVGEHTVTATIMYDGKVTVSGYISSCKFRLWEKDTFPRRTVFEEATGTWCGWCVRGIVAFKEMQAKYPDNFIGIAIHGGDEMEFEDEYGLSFSGYPQAYVNRKNRIGVNRNIFESSILSAGTKTDVNVDIESITPSSDRQSWEIKTNTLFTIDKSFTDYRLVYVITEDNVGPYYQRNFYSGGANGIMGGYELLSKYEKTSFDNVARAVYPDINGVPHSIPSSVKAKTDNKYSYTVPIPQNISNLQNVYVTVMIYDIQNDQIVNADRAKCPY